MFKIRITVNTLEPKKNLGPVIEINFNINEQSLLNELVTIVTIILKAMLFISKYKLFLCLTSVVRKNIATLANVTFVLKKIKVTV